LTSLSLSGNLRTSMYAVIETGGKQYRVQPGDVVQVEKLDGKIGAPIKFGQILFVSRPGDTNSEIWLGKPYLNGASVATEVVGQGRGEKILIVKMKRRKQYRRTQGHRQEYTQVLVTAIDNGAGQKAEISAEDKKNRLSKFHSQLKPKGPAQKAPRINRRKLITKAEPKSAKA